jgi:mannose-6-phosphate isomerase-like protein (cupin superfamily)
MRAQLDQLLARIEGAPNGPRFVEALRHSSMQVELFAPKHRDVQQPHKQDELYFIVCGSAEFLHLGQTSAVAAGDALFVRAGEMHRFSRFSDDFLTWVVFWGPEGGEAR